MVIPVAAIARVMRPRHWVKNLFVLAPLLMTPSAVDPTRLKATLLGMLAFCLMASATYVLNDLKDRDSDRLHPDKRHRPIASGALSPGGAVWLMALLAAAGLGLAFALSRPFGLVIGFYFGLTTAYSLKLKHIAVLDIMVLAAGFILRLEGGALLARVPLSVWIILCTWLLALFLAVAKRRDDLVRGLDESHRGSLDGYTVEFVDKAMVILTAGLFICYTIYTADKDVMERLGSSHLYLTVPFVLAGVLRYLQITIVEKRSGAPTDLALGDPFLLITLFGWAALFGGLIYL
ncbi:MAG: UbiA prenyltransferase family protein [Magnetospirillum sp.]|nr:UbiA prenyltransferase family protein [Magnetospirillum sp.]